MSAGVVIAGGGLAAQRACETLRRRGYEGRVRMVCAEAALPYDRPPLSKELLAGCRSAGALCYRPKSWYADHEVEPLLATRAEGLDLPAKRLTVSSGAALPYDMLLIATGAKARRIPLLESYRNVSVLRTVTDAARLRGALEPGTALAIVGAGFIGQEVAATARRLGVEVTVIEAQAAPLVNELGLQLAGWFGELHRSEGVRLLLGDTLAAVRGRGRVEELILSSGARVECGHVLVGVGTEPSLEFLAGTGLDPRGLSIDEAGWTGAPGVYAAGDVTVPYEPALGCRRRTQHWEAAARQGVAAASAMIGLAPPSPAAASFWSDQYGVRIHYVGYASEADEVTVSGDPESRRFSAIFRRDTHVVAALLVGMSKRLRDARSEVEAGLRLLGRSRGGAPCPTL